MQELKLSKHMNMLDLLKKASEKEERRFNK